MKNYKKAILASLAMVGTSCAIISGATFALFSNESTTNIAITSGKIDVQATGTVSSYYTVSGGAKTEGEWSNGDVTVDGSLVSVNNIYHGEGVILDIEVENKSSINVKYQVSLTGVAAYAVSSNGVYKNVKVSTVESAVDFVSVGNGTYLTNWTSVVEPETITHISVDIRLPEYADNYDGSSCEYTIGVNAVQGNKHVEDPEEVPDDDLVDVVIPEGTTQISVGQFQNNTNIGSVTIPSSVTTIYQRAFQNCTNLKEVIFADDIELEFIGVQAFLGCTSLERIEIPASVTKIDTNAFDGCKSLKEIIFSGESRLEEIEANVFSGCTSLESVNIPASVTQIGTSAFVGCSNLKNVTFGEGSNLTTIATRMFNSCTSLQSVVIPASVTEILDGAFNGCSNLAIVYYGGTEEQWPTISIDNTNTNYLSGATIYYFSEENPFDIGVEDGNFWHYENGEIVVWTKN